MTAYQQIEELVDLGYKISIDLRVRISGRTTYSVVAQQGSKQIFESSPHLQDAIDLAWQEIKTKTNENNN